MGVFEDQQDGSDRRQFRHLLCQRSQGLFLLFLRTHGESRIALDRQ